MSFDMFVSYCVGLGRVLKAVPFRMDAEDRETWFSSGLEGDL